jgi:DNA-binding CsgD family transcriptional regulator
VRFVIQDDGKGFDPSEVLDSASGLGLAAMEERLNMVGGSFQIWTAKETRAPIDLHHPHDADRRGAMTPYTIVLADDHVLFRQGVKKIIEEVDGLQVVGEANDGLELLEILKKATRPGHPRHLHAQPAGPGSGPGNQGAVSPGQGPAPYHAQEKRLPAAGPGGRGGRLPGEGRRRRRPVASRPGHQKRGQILFPLLSTRLADLASHKGQTDPLSKREKEVAKLLAEGKTSKEVADLLYISIYTVRRHRDNIMRKLDLKGLADLVRYAMEQGYTSGNS